MKYSDAAPLLQLVTIVATALFVTTGIVLARRRKAAHGRFSIVPILLAVAVDVLFIALTHLILGGQLSDAQRRGLWSEGTLTAFPTSFAALGGLLTSTWAVLWTAENTANQTETSAVRAEAETRRQQVAELKTLFARLEREFGPIHDVWLKPGATRARALWDLIKKTWTDVLSPGSDLLSAPLNGDCAHGHEVALPDINMFVPRGEAGSVDLGCPHFQEEIYGRLPELERIAVQLAVNRASAAREVRAISKKLIPLLERYGLPVRALLDDAAYLCRVYPEQPPDPTTPEGRDQLSYPLFVTYVLNGHEEEWDQTFLDLADAKGVRVAPPRDPAGKAKFIEFVNASAESREKLSQALGRRLAQEDRTLGRGSRVQFWLDIAGEVAPARTE